MRELVLEVVDLFGCDRWFASNFPVDRVMGIPVAPAVAEVVTDRAPDEAEDPRVVGTMMYLPEEDNACTAIGGIQ